MGRTFLIALLIAGTLAVAADYGSGGMLRGLVSSENGDGALPGACRRPRRNGQRGDRARAPSPARPLPQAASPVVPLAPPQVVQLPDAPNPSSIRNVTPSDILPPPRVSGPLKRVASQVPKLPEREIPTEITFHQPLVIDAGSFRTKQLTIRLAGIDAPLLEETCPSRLGGTWPCGMRARTALRGLVRRHAITCDDMQDTPAGVVLAQCRKQGTDLAAWMVAQGWARPGEGAGEDLVAASEAAREARRGIWQLDGPAPLSHFPSLSAGEAQDDDTPADEGTPEATAGAPSPLDPDRQPGADADPARALSLDLPPVEITETPWHPGNRN
ncbi:thermonuclease family protein [Stappia sp. 28M-7]|uniref:thermonuclease family protein n=1 Tax=Stappia sp. 28M-7 TaxID=2762596 RepID=UPI00163D04E0|nr:thermonuclease family protein [Stappia sp. 28M-7]MBC2858385.1 thermonuclease family protein [Stappia sp. 28M-7]